MESQTASGIQQGRQRVPEHGNLEKAAHIDRLCANGTRAPACVACLKRFLRSMFTREGNCSRALVATYPTVTARRMR